MRKKTILSLLAILLFAIACKNTKEPADRILKNGNIYTVDEKNPNAEAIAIKNGKIIFVGSNNEVEKYVGDNTQIEDLEGNFVLPGFIDTHAHYAFGASGAVGISLDPHGTPEQWIAQIKKFADEHSDYSSIFGLGIMPLKFGKNGPTKELLDKIIPNRPAMILDEGGHTCWVNSKAYELAGITKDTPDPIPGVHMYKRKANGEPSGWNLEAMTIFPMISQLNLLPSELIQKSAEKMLPFASSAGVTTYYDAGMMQMEDLVYPALQRLEKEGKLPLKIVGSYIVQAPMLVPNAIEKLKELQKKYQSELIYPNTIKIHNDGTLESETAALFEDYSDTPNNKGGMVLEGDILKNFVADIASNDFHVHIHAIGDKTISEALDAIEYAKNKAPNSKSRYTIAHAIVIQDKDVPRFGQLNVIAQTTPVWIGDEATISPALGEERSKKRYLIKSIEDGGAKVTFGSDFPVGGEFGMFPLYNIQVGMTRQGLDEGAVPLPPITEKMPLESMIKGYTINAAYQLGMEDKIGSLEKGKYADIVILNKDLFKIKPNEIHKVEVKETIMNGNTTYKAE